MKEESSTDWENLIQKHLDGLTTDTEVAVLSAQIVADANVRSLYLKAAQVHGALADEVLAVDLETIEIPIQNTKPKQDRDIRRFAWPQQLAAGLVAGALVGLLGVGGVWAVSSPKSEASPVKISNGDFEEFSGPVDLGFPVRFGHWSGNPAEVIEEADGNRILRLLETANVKGDPNGGATNCSVFQLVDLSSIRKQWGADASDAQISLELSARFRRDSASTDGEFPKLRGSCRIFLFQADPGSIGDQWPQVAREAIASGNKKIKLEAGGDSATVSASCLLDSEATVALISVAASIGEHTTTPVELGGYYVDDVELTVIKQPNLPVRYVK